MNQPEHLAVALAYALAGSRMPIIADPVFLTVNATPVRAELAAAAHRALSRVRSNYTRSRDADGEINEARLDAGVAAESEVRSAINALAADTHAHALDRKASAAEETLRRLGYTYRGGVLWAPPVGEPPAFDNEPAQQGHSVTVQMPLHIRTSRVRVHLQASSAAQVPEGLLDWAVSRWEAEVKHRPLVNKHRRTLDDTWRQVILFAGGNPVALVGPAHDTLLAADPAAGGEHG